MRNERADFYQITLIVLALVVTAGFGIFIYREAFPEYRIYQKQYVALEEMRAEETGMAVAPFKSGVKQTVLLPDDNGPATIDRCESCHVALKLPHFSKTKVATDVNGLPRVDGDGYPILVPNENYVWGKVDKKIAESTDEALVAKLEAMKHVHVNGHDYDMTKVLSAHPLLGREMRPFDQHPVEEFGCTVCHQGNGRGLSTDRAHGPVFSDPHHAAAHGPRPEFLERDEKNDPAFANAFNGVPEHKLLFQTTPLFPGSVMDAKCMQCHQSTQDEGARVVSSLHQISMRKEGQIEAIDDGLQKDKKALISLVTLREMVKSEGVRGALDGLRKERENFRLTADELGDVEGKIEYLEAAVSGREDQGNVTVYETVDHDLIDLLGSKQLAWFLQKELASESGAVEAQLNVFLEEQQVNQGATGSIFQKMRAKKRYQNAVGELEGAAKPLKSALGSKELTRALAGDVDQLTKSHQRGRNLFMQNACYACHQIKGFSRGGVGPELTTIGLQYPWYVKESITWPQGNLATSTMPNFRLDHEEVEDLMAYLMAQRNEHRLVSEVDERVNLNQWEKGAKMPWEEPVPAADVMDVEAGMMTFATEGCASCHKLKGFESQVGFAVEKEQGSFEKVWAERQWFKELFPEYVTGSRLVAALDQHKDMVNRRLVSDVRSKGILEKIEEKEPRSMEGYYTSFKYALRAKNHEFDLMDREGKDSSLARKEWHDLVNKVMMVYVQEFGLGRDIAPRLNWSGVYRDKEWLIGHFRAPGSYTAKSLMPVLPFDSSKFYQLTHLLQELGKQNRDEVKMVRAERGFDPEQAYSEHCSSCHGEFQQGREAPIAQWIYPIPKNLRNATFLRNLTKERAIESIVHGVRGTPMPPWGEDALAGPGDKSNPVLTRAEITQLVDWLFLSLPGSQVIKSEKDVDKWQYDPSDVIQDLEEEGSPLKGKRSDQPSILSFADQQLLNSLPTGEGLYAAMEPKVYVGGKVEDVFDVRKQQDDYLDQELYYIKRDFYTEDNLKEGERLFISNCSHCHGKEGAGNGERAVTMSESKPRMLSNLYWINTRDDLRLLRSIKYGVTGTSMTPWGDKTSALQRMQMVMFIRELSGAKRLRDELGQSLYRSFEKAQMTVGAVRGAKDKGIQELESRYLDAQSKREQAQRAVESGASVGNAGALYEKEMQLLIELNEAKKEEERLSALISGIQAESKVYRILGQTLIDRNIDQRILDDYFALISSQQGRYVVNNGKLQFQLQPDSESRIKRLGQEIDQYLVGRLSELENRRKLTSAKFSSAERQKELQEIAERIKGLTKVRRALLSSFEQASRLREQQRELASQL